MAAILHYIKSKVCRGCMFSNAVKINIFILDVQFYVPIKLCKMTGSICLFKITGTFNSENVKLNRNYIWDPLEIYWKEVKLVTIKLKDKLKIRHFDEERTTALSCHAKTRNYLVHIDFQHSRSYKRQYRYKI